MVICFSVLFSLHRNKILVLRILIYVCITWGFVQYLCIVF